MKYTYDIIKANIEKFKKFKSELPFDIESSNLSNLENHILNRYNLSEYNFFSNFIKNRIIIYNEKIELEDIKNHIINGMKQGDIPKIYIEHVKSLNLSNFIEFLCSDDFLIPAQLKYDVSNNRNILHQMYIYDINTHLLSNFSIQNNIQCESLINKFYLKNLNDININDIKKEFKKYESIITYLMNNYISNTNPFKINIDVIKVLFNEKIKEQFFNDGMCIKYLGGENNLNLTKGNFYTINNCTLHNYYDHNITFKIIDDNNDNITIRLDAYCKEIFETIAQHRDKICNNLLQDEN